ncbi:MAG: hypothetical protein BGO98_02995 [Myxococcales bacterium 68-20]|nr:MAG: hypothetical protein BGO98_02995 [Myxococcales bacterium 68-20]
MRYLRRSAVAASARKRAPTEGVTRGTTLDVANGLERGGRRRSGICFERGRGRGSSMAWRGVPRTTMGRTNVAPRSSSSSSR